MSNEGIKKSVDQLYIDIATARDRIKQIQESCKHEHTHETLYSYRPGTVHAVEMCNYCREIIRYLSSQ